jgi:hypothetical protein
MTVDWLHFHTTILRVVCTSTKALFVNISFFLVSVPCRSVMSLILHQTRNQPRVLSVNTQLGVSIALQDITWIEKTTANSLGHQLALRVVAVMKHIIVGLFGANLQITQMPLDIQQRVLGSEHPGTMKTSRNLATCLRAAHGTTTSAT